MISRGLFQTQLNTIEHNLKKLGLLDERSPAPQYSEVGASFFRTMSYSKIWHWCFDNNFYDFLLKDGSLFQFKINRSAKIELSYCYYDSPFLPIITFDDFFNENQSQEDIDEYDIIRLYEYYVADPPKKEIVSPIRYDYSPDQYTVGRHPASHLHLGYNNEIRIGTKKILRPISFFLFILRQQYPQLWTKFIAFEESAILTRDIRENLPHVSDEYFKEQDLLEMLLQ